MAIHNRNWLTKIYMKKKSVGSFTLSASQDSMYQSSIG